MIDFLFFARNDVRLLIATASLAATMLVAGCGGEAENLALNNVVATLNGSGWIGDQAVAQLEATDNNQLRLTIRATNSSNEAIFVRVTEIEQNMVGLHEVTSLANGEFIAFSNEITPNTLESHASFGCQTVNGIIDIRDFNREEGYVSGFFEGSVCRSDGSELIAILEGEFFRLSF